MNLSQLPAVVSTRDIRNARLPINYEAAKKALAECVSLDECKDWADRTAAIATYARQIRDNEMLEAAQRIKLRAEARLGELLRQIPRAPAIYDHDKKKMAPNPGNRYRLAELAGISFQKASEAITISRVPPKRRDKLIEQSPPVKRSELMRLGTTPREGYSTTYTPPPRPPGGYLGNFIDWASENSPKEVAREILKADTKWVLAHYPALLEWLEEVRALLLERSPQSEEAP